MQVLAWGPGHTAYVRATGHIPLRPKAMHEAVQLLSCMNSPRCAPDDLRAELAQLDVPALVAYFDHLVAQNELFEVREQCTAEQICIRFLRQDVMSRAAPAPASAEAAVPAIAVTALPLAQASRRAELLICARPRVHTLWGVD